MELGQPSALAGDNLSQAVQASRTLPLLSTDAEVALCHRWRDHHDISAAHRLAASHLRLVVEIAEGYRGYGLPFDDLAGEGHLGLMRAICRFDPDHGVAFGAYATWWIRSAIEEYVLENWSHETMGTTAARKKLLVSLQLARGRIEELLDGAVKRERARKPRTASRVSEQRYGKPTPGSRIKAQSEAHPSPF
jgi:RNA polymerase sigma-32 factor